MADSRPIGIFDSGLGGLTVAKEIFNTLPNESIIYIGDTARVPYGNRSAETIIQFSQELVSFLINQDVKAIVIACATASSVALDNVRQQFPQLPIYGVIDAAAKTTSQTTKNHHIGIIGTQITIDSGTFERSIKACDPNATIYPKACPLLVPIIEEGIHEGKMIHDMVKHYLFDQFPSIDTLVLGCTHYPIIAPIIQPYVPHATLINPGKSLAISLKQDLDSKQLLSTDTTPNHAFYATDITKNFEQIAQMFLGMPITIKHHHLEN